MPEVSGMKTWDHGVCWALVELRAFQPPERPADRGNEDRKNSFESHSIAAMFNFLGKNMSQKTKLGKTVETLLF